MSFDYIPSRSIRYHHTVFAVTDERYFSSSYVRSPGLLCVRRTSSNATSQSRERYSWADPYPRSSSRWWISVYRSSGLSPNATGIRGVSLDPLTKPCRDFVHKPHRGLACRIEERTIRSGVPPRRRHWQNTFFATDTSLARRCGTGKQRGVPRSRFQESGSHRHRTAVSTSRIRSQCPSSLVPPPKQNRCDGTNRTVG